MRQPTLTPAHYTAYRACVYCGRCVILVIPGARISPMCDACWRIGEPYRAQWRAACQQTVEEGQTPDADV